MKSLINIVFFLLVGAFVGWFANDLATSRDKEKISLSHKEKPLELRKAPDVVAKKNPEAYPPVLLDQRLLSNPRLDKLIEIFTLEMNAEEKVKIDQQLVQHAQSLIDRAVKHDNVERQLLNMSNIASIEARILPVLIKYYVQSGQNLAAIEQLFRLKKLVSFDDDYQAVTLQIKQLTEKHVKHLIHMNRKEKLVDFYETLLLLEPDNYELQMQYAKSEYDNQHYENALRLLNVLIYHTELEDQALQLLQKTQNKLESVSRGDVAISIVKQGEQYIVSAMINDLEPVKLMLDTGASMTIVSPKVMHSLGLSADNVQKTMRFSTAGGEVVAPVIVIDKIEVQRYSVNDLQVAVLRAFPMGSIDGLLGMNFLSHFSFFIDQENLTLQLREKD